LHLGKFTSENAKSIFENLLSWESIARFALRFILIFYLLFINWRTLTQRKKFELEFKIFI
jgi:hypothetical protein